MIRFAGMASVATLLVACASNPENAVLRSAEAEVERMRSVQGIDGAAASHVDAAEREITWARQLHDVGRDEALVEHHAVLAHKHAEIARERQRLARVEREIDEADERRQQLLLNASRRDAALAEREAQQARARNHAQ